MSATRTKTNPAETFSMKAPSGEEIAARAYEIYMERAADEGTATEDWLRAERELLQEQLRHLSPIASARRPSRHVTEHDLASK